MYVFEIPGAPVSQKRHRSVVRGGKVWQYDPSKADKERIQSCVDMGSASLIAGPIRFTMVCYLPFPSGASAKVRDMMRRGLILPDVKPDWDNLGKLASDALNNLVYDDDRRITDARVLKRYGDKPTTVIHIEPIQIDPEDPIATPTWAEATQCG